MLRKATLLAVISASTTATASFADPADDAAARATDHPFTLGQILVTAPYREGIDIGQSSVSAEAIYVFNRNSLDDAANIMPGLTASNSGGSRNERLIYLRGFDRFQVPLLIDGIRVYLPADNRLDYGRFLTPDIAEIQVAKGYASVLDGPGAMGGAINLVTRKPARELEAEARAGLSLDRDLGYGGHTVFGSIGSRRDLWYAQFSYARNETDHWDLPAGYRPAAGAAEDGGARDFSDSRDWRINFKAAYTPNDADEYAISYTRQEGAKNAPLHVSDPLNLQRFWSWPFWNMDSLYFLSTTGISARMTLKTRIYRNTFKNLLSSFDNRDQNSQTIGRAFNSYYDDEAYGGSAQLDTRVTDRNSLRIAFHYRRDKHVEYQQGFPSGATEPEQVNLEHTYSLAAENELAVNDRLTLFLGASYDWRDLRRAEEYGVPPGGGPDALFSYPMRDADAFNAQGRLVWTPAEDTRIHAGISSRTRFPSVFERFSSRFGGATSNPALKAERATHFELGGARSFGRAHMEGSVFYARVDDAIVAFPTVITVCTAPGVCTDNAVSQNRNLGKGDYYGLELALTAQLAEGLDIGGNYTWTRRELDDPGNAAFRPTGVPAHKAFAWAQWTAHERIQVVPSVDITSNQWTVNTAGTLYYRTGASIRANLRADFELRDGFDFSVGVNNLFDDHYQLVDGFPERGRSFFTSLRARY